MDFTLTEEQRALRDAARRFARGELDRAGARPREERTRPCRSQWRKRYAEMGFLGINLPEPTAAWASATSTRCWCWRSSRRCRRRSRSRSSRARPGRCATIVHFALRRAASERIIPRVVRGEIVVAVVDVGARRRHRADRPRRTRGRIDGDAIVVNGQKRWCSGGGHADGYVVYCRLSDAPGAAGIGAV